MARTTFLDEVEPRAIHSMRNAGHTPDEAADRYDQLLRNASPLGLVHLGLGPDGHTASLFPGSPALSVDPGRLVVLNEDPNGNNPYQRMTLTFSGIARARLVIFTVSGEEKREAMQQVIDGADIPAAHVTAERIVWLVDPSAAPK
jgi:6-phosphogluconolactonase/glucosamine-6-phosphate isomerase/deaminase